MMHSNRRGFTLIELMVVIVILGIISTIALVFLFDEPDKARWEKARTEMGQIHKTLGMFKTENGGDWPESLDEIADKFGSKLPKDPWTKQPFVYEKSGNSFTLKCLGKDKTEGGDKVPDKDIVYNEYGYVEDGAN